MHMRAHTTNQTNASCLVSPSSLSRSAQMLLSFSFSASTKRIAGDDSFDEASRSSSTCADEECEVMIICKKSSNNYK
jgi:hypothetical protein